MMRKAVKGAAEWIVLLGLAAVIWGLVFYVRDNWRNIAKQQSDLETLVASLEVQQDRLQKVVAALELKKGAVVENMKASGWEYRDCGWTARVTGKKNRGECSKLIGVYYAANGISGDPRVIFLDDDSPNSAKPAGEFDFGVWCFRGDLSVGDTVRVWSRHTCGEWPSQFDVTTDFGEWRIERTD